ncbi:MAG: hypothetical protein E7670_02305 [Ruminococcaceae bacterium]|nr:hypothetical protein [Oscillospiraceae bacterium]
MHIIMDMGTSNTRLFLCDGDMVIASKKGAFGAGVTKKSGRDFLTASLKALIFELCSENKADADLLDAIIVSGMAGSEIGLLDVPHMNIPTGIGELAENVVKADISEVCSAPFIFVRGLKKTEGEDVCDMMRGEETETVGIILAQGLQADSLLVLPGTHNKVICVNARGEITDFATTFSGELLSGIMQHSILSGQVSYDFEIVEKEIFRGAEYSKENGLNAAIFHVRVDGKNGKNKDELTSFLFGAVIGEDIPLITRMAKDKNIYVGGRENLKKIYSMLIGDAAVPLEASVADDAVRRGLSAIYKLI